MYRYRETMLVLTRTSTRTKTYSTLLLSLHVINLIFMYGDQLNVSFTHYLILILRRRYYNADGRANNEKQVRLHDVHNF